MPICSPSMVAASTITPLGNAPKTSRNAVGASRVGSGDDVVGLIAVPRSQRW
jgi:hypothetical protein